MILRQILQGLTKMFISFVNNKLQILLWIIALTVLKILSSHANFRLDIFHSKTLLYSFWGQENGLKAGKICKLFSHLNICVHLHIFIRLQILRMNIFILHQIAAQALVHIAVSKVMSNCLIYQ